MTFLFIGNRYDVLSFCCYFEFLHLFFVVTLICGLFINLCSTVFINVNLSLYGYSTTALILFKKYSQTCTCGHLY